MSDDWLERSRDLSRKRIPRLPPFPLPPWHQKNHDSLTNGQRRELYDILDRFQKWIFQEIEKTGNPPDIRTCSYMLGCKGSDSVGARYRNMVIKKWNCLNPAKKLPIVGSGESQQKLAHLVKAMAKRYRG